MLKRLALRDFVIVTELEVEFDAGFSVLTGETGAGKSILIDALQLALGSRGDVGLVREGCTRAEVSAEFEDLPLALQPWLEAAGFEASDSLLLRRTLDAQGKSRAWINGSPATVGQLREAADHLVEIHGQHAWQRLTRAGDARALLDAQAGVDPARIAQLHARWKDASAALQRAREQGDEIERERERLAWQIHELDRLAPGAAEWDELNAEHGRLSHAQALIDAARSALDGLSQADGSAIEQTDRALAALQPVARYDAALMPMIDVLQGAQAQLADAAHSLHAYLDRDRADASRLVELDARLSAWHGLARRLRRPAVRAARVAGAVEGRAARAGGRARRVGTRGRREPGRARLPPRRRTVDRAASARRRCAGARGDAGDAGPGHGGRAVRRGAVAATAAAELWSRKRRVPGCRPCGRHAACAGQGGLGWRAVAPGAGHRGHHVARAPRVELGRAGGAAA